MTKRRRSFGKKLEKTRKKVFVGREAVIKKFHDNLKLDPYNNNYFNIFNIYGQGGVGKTTLVNKYISLCDEENYVAVKIDLQEGRLYEVLETLDNLAQQFEKQGYAFKKFKKRYKEYTEKYADLKANLKKSESTAGKLVKGTVKAGTTLGKELVPGGGLIFGALPTNTLAEIAGDWTDNLVSKIANKEDRVLVLNPLGELTPLWIDDLCEIPEDKEIAIFLDTFETSNPLLSKWLLKLFSLKYGEIPNILFVISGRIPLDIIAWSDFAHLIHKISLEPFTNNEAKDFLTANGITNQQTIDTFLKLSGGLPVYIDLLVRGHVLNPGEINDPNEIIVERFLKHVKEPTHKAVALLAAIPNKFNQDILECLLPEAEQQNVKAYFNWIIDMPFVEKRDKYWAYHSVVREVFLKYQKERSEKEWEDLHTKLVLWYYKKLTQDENQENKLKQAQFRDLIFEKHFHQLCLNYQKHFPFALNDFVSLLNDGLTEQAPALVKYINNAEVYLGLPENWSSLLSKGIDSLLANNRPEALAMFENINNSNLISEPENKFYVLDRLGGYTEELEERLKYYTEALALNHKKAVCYNSIGVVYSRKSNHKKAIDAFNNAIAANPERELYYENLATTLAATGNYQEAFNNFAKATEIEPNYFTAYHNWAYYLLDLADTKTGKDAEKLYLEAIDKYQKVIYLSHEALHARYNLGSVLVKLSKLQNTKQAEESLLKAINYYKSIININPNFQNSYYNWGCVLIELFELKKGTPTAEKIINEAINRLKKAIELDPDFISAYINYSISLEELAGLKIGQEAEELLTKSINSLKTALKKQPDSSKVFESLALTLSELSDLKTGKIAEELLEEAINNYAHLKKLEPNKFHYYKNWGLALSKLANLKEGLAKEKLLTQAIEKHKISIKHQPNLINAYLYLWDGLFEMAKIKEPASAKNILTEAVKVHQKAVTLAPDKGNIYYNLGLTLRKLADLNTGAKAKELLKQAIKKYNMAIERQPHKYLSYYNCGEALRALANLETTENAQAVLWEAVDNYENGIKLNANFAAAYINLALTQNALRSYPQSHRAQDLATKAIDNFKKALEINPNNAIVAFNLGVMCFSTLRLEEAKEALLISADLETDYLTSKYLGHVYLAEQNKEKAQQYYKQSQQLFNNNKDFTNVMKADYENANLIHYDINKVEYFAMVAELENNQP